MFGKIINIDLKDVIAEPFYETIYDIIDDKYTHYLLRGGRGGTRSTFASVIIILGIIQDPLAHAVCYRKVHDTCSDSVYSQMLWVIEKLNLTNEFKCTVKPLKIKYKPTGQTILFRGMDDPDKAKSIKVKLGYIKFGWFEEFDQFDGMEAIRKVTQSLMRGGPTFTFFYTYNPPKSMQHWLNIFVENLKSDRWGKYHSTYLEVPKEWNGVEFWLEAEELKESKPKSYDHEYLGIITGTGSEVFDNLNIREITDEEIAIFDNIESGLDFGFAVDELAYNRSHFNSKRKILYIFYEIYLLRTSNLDLFYKIKDHLGDSIYERITADSAEPKSINELKQLGLNIKGAIKGPDSVTFGYRNLQAMNEIVIDPVRCPNAAREFRNIAYKRDKNDAILSAVEDKKNHTIDGTRYRMESTLRKKWGF